MDFNNNRFLFDDYLNKRILGIILILQSAHFMEIEINQIKWKKLCNLLKQCLPLFIVCFLTFYITNSPKYAIDAAFSDDIQAYYSFIAMPVFVIELLSNFIYQPNLVAIATAWNRCQYTRFSRMCKRQILVIVILMLICLAGAYFIGIPVLSLVYNADLSPYKSELLILLCGGGMMAMSTFFCVLMTVIRKQSLLVYGYASVALGALLLCNKVVSKYGITGAAIFYTFLELTLAILFGIMFSNAYTKEKQ